MNPLIGNQFPSIQELHFGRQVPAQNQPAVSLNPKGGQEKALTFGEVFQKTSDQSALELKFSKHANERMSSRNIDLTTSQLARLKLGAKRAGEKGIRESLVMVDDLAFIVNIKSNMVITAVEKEDKIFTNIDGAVIM